MPDSHENSARQGVQVIARAASVLRALKAGRTGMSLGQIAQAVDLPRSTVQRIVRALQDEALVVAGPDGLRLGPGIHELADTQDDGIIARCRPLLEALSRTTGETADLSVLRGNAMVFLDQVPGSHRLRTVSAVGDTFPLTTTANGRACLARLPKEKASGLILAEWHRRGIGGDMARFRQRLDEFASSGFAVDLDEHTMGISAIGFAFDGPGDTLHAISVPIPSSRYDAVRAGVEAALGATALSVLDMRA